MNALLVDSSAPREAEQPAAADGQAGGSTPPGAGEPSAQAASGRTCASCDAPLQDGQQWCLHCGAGQPGSLGEPRGWRPLSTLALAALLLVVAAAAAGAAALGSHKSTPPAAPLTVAQAPATATPPPATAPGAATTTPSIPATPPAASTPVKAPRIPKASTGANPLFPSTSKPPKLPAPASTPKTQGTGTGTQTAPSTKATGTGTTTEAKSPSSSEGNAEQPSAILLDTNAASTYNPYKYPEAGFGDPALAIDQEVATAWTAQVQPSSAPLMAAGLLVDLNTPTRLGSVKLITMTPGMTVQIYGASGSQAPTAITEPGWTPLSASHVLKKKSSQLKLNTGGKSFRFLVVWIVKAPASAVGTPQAPGHVDINEVELFPPSGS